MSGVIKAIKHPGKAIKHLIHNPASAIVPKPIRDSSIYKNVVRPVIKTGAALGIGYLTGGIGGALMAGGTGILGGSLGNKAFNPMTNIVTPAITGLATGAALGSGYGGQLASKAGELYNSSGLGSLFGGNSATSGGGNTLWDMAKSGAKTLGKNALSSVFGGGGSGGGGSPGVGDWVNGLASIGGAYFAGQGAKSAADAQIAAANIASQNQMNMFNQNRADMLPWRVAGANALSDLTHGAIGPNADLTRKFTANDFTADPGYQFRKSEGNNAINTKLAAMGLNNSGRSVREGAKFNQGLADQAYQGAYNRFNADQAKKFNALSAISGTGQTTANQVANMGTSAANQVAANTIGAGNARAGGIVGRNNAYMGGLNSIAQIFNQRSA